MSSRSRPVLLIQQVLPDIFPTGDSVVAGLSLVVLSLQDTRQQKPSGKFEE